MPTYRITNEPASSPAFLAGSPRHHFAGETAGKPCPMNPLDDEWRFCLPAGFWLHRRHV